MKGEYFHREIFTLLGVCSLYQILQQERKNVYAYASGKLLARRVSKVHSKPFDSILKMQDQGEVVGRF